MVHGLERYLTLLGPIAAISPLLGLLGTVTGMVRIFAAISATGADIIALVTFSGENPSNATVVVKVTDVDKETLENAVKPVVIKIDDLRDCC